ncbi:MAG: hypothetical protein NVSMB28_32850 [Collimonas sp.]
MKRFTVLWFAVAALMLGAASDFAVAENHGFQGHGGGFHGNASGMNHGGMNRGGGMEARHGFHRFHDFHGRTRIIIGGPFFWPPIYYDPAFYPGPSSLMYVPPGADFSYYCTDPAGYYPDVPSCPGGWLRVVPGDAPY